MSRNSSAEGAENRPTAPLEGAPIIARQDPTTQKSDRRRSSPTLAILARRLGVSSMAVSFALNGRPGVSDELRKAALELAEEVGYRPNLAARTLRTERTAMMGIINRNLHNPAFLEVIEGFDEECSNHGYQVMIGSSRLDLTHEISLINAFSARELEGLAIAPLAPQAALEAWQRNKNRPIAILSSAIATKNDLVVSIKTDSSMSVRLAVEHLHELGHTKISLLVGTDTVPVDPELDQAFRTMMEERSLKPDFIACGWDLQEARAIIGKRIAKVRPMPPTAIIASTDHLAHATYLAARDIGLRIPEDLSVMGHDDVHTSQLLDPPLTTFRSDRFAIGQQSARLLIDISRGTTPTERHITLPVALQIRGSTAQAHVSPRPTR